MQPTLPAAFTLIALDSVDSTNEEAKRLAATPEDQGGPLDGTVVWARAQTAGKGRRGRDWQSPEGNLYCSLILRPDCPPAEAPQLGFALALAAGQAIAAFVPPMTELTYKWPNDVLLNNGKVAGILLESGPVTEGVVSYVVAGLGINVGRAPEPDSVRYPATSVVAEGGAEATVETVLQGVCRGFMHWAGRWVAEGFTPLRKAWLDHAASRGETITVDTGAETVTGRFDGLTEDGQLSLTRSDGTTRILPAGDVLPDGA